MEISEQFENWRPLLSFDGALTAERLGQNVAVENVAGASGTIGTAKIVRAKPDGYTLLMGSGSEISVAKLITPDATYDGERDLAPISLIGTAPMVLVGGSKRSPVAPNIPALTENRNLAGIDIGVWYGLFTLAKTHTAIIERLHKEVVEAVKNPKLVSTLADQGISIVGSTPAELGALIRKNTEKYRGIVQSANIRVE